MTSSLLQSPASDQPDPGPDTGRQSVARDALVLTVSQYAAGAIGLVTSVVTARLLGPDAYGTAALAVTYPTFLWTFLSFKPITVATRYLAEFISGERWERVRSLSKLCYGIDLLAAVAVLILVAFTGTWVAGRIFHSHELSWLMIGYAVSLPFYSLTGTSLAILTARNRFHWIAAFQVLERIAILALVIGPLLAGFGVRAVVLGTAAGQALGGLWIALVAARDVERDGAKAWWRASLRDVSPLGKELTAFFTWNYLGVTLSGIMGHAPLMLLGHFRGSQEAGLYRLATTLVTAGSYPEASLGRVVYPALAGQWATGDRGIVRRRLVRWTFREGLIAGTLVFATIPLLPLVVPPIFGTDFGAMVFGTQIMMLGAVISAAFFWLTSFYYASGRIDSWTKAYAVYMALVTGLTWLVVQRWGFSGVAVLVGLGKATFAASMVVPVLFLKGAFRESIRMPQSGRNGKVLCDSSGVSTHLERPST